MASTKKEELQLVENDKNNTIERETKGDRRWSFEKGKQKSIADKLFIWLVGRAYRDSSQRQPTLSVTSDVR